jgi:hypothetical protein
MQHMRAAGDAQCTPFASLHPGAWECSLPICRNSLDGAELSTIATQELAPYSEKDEKRVRIDGPQVLLEPNAAQAIAVTLHELATTDAPLPDVTQAAN